MVDELLEPLKVYKNKFKEVHYNKTVEYFDNLVSKSKIDIDANKKTCAEYYTECNNLENLNKRIKTRKTIRTILIVLMIVSIAAVIIMFYMNVDNKIAIPVLAGVVVFSIISLLVIFLKLNKDIKKLNTQKEILEIRIKELYNLAMEQMYPLNTLYDWNIPATIINNSNSVIEMDKFFEVDKFKYLHENYGFNENTAPNVSTVFVQSGSILGNPFVMCRDYIQSWGEKTYTGSITIHWTERVRTKNGTRTVHRSQVLTASVTKPIPVYELVTNMIYANDAAPNLTFTRSPSGVSLMTDKQIDKVVKKKNKKLDKMAKEHLMDNDETTNYTRFKDDEFEAIFGGTDRNNEVEYRMLFTPLAQKNLLELIKEDEPYGDDFYFVKDRKINYVQSKHSQTFNYKANPSLFHHFDYEKARERFIKYNIQYFQGFFFDLAPLISIPLYQHTKAIDYIYDDTKESNITSYEHEVLVNALDVDSLKHPMTDTNVILKTKMINKLDKRDVIKVTAHSFNAIPYTTYISKYGGDGRYHDVPVTWYDYEPLEQETYVTVETKDTSRYNYDSTKPKSDYLAYLLAMGIGGASIFERGLFASVLSNVLSEDDAKKFTGNLSTNIDNNNNKDIESKINNIVEEIKDISDKAVKDVGGNITSRSEGSNNNENSNIA